MIYTTLSPYITMMSNFVIYVKQPLYNYLELNTFGLLNTVNIIKQTKISTFTQNCPHVTIKNLYQRSNLSRWFCVKLKFRKRQTATLYSCCISYRITNYNRWTFNYMCCMWIKSSHPQQYNTHVYLINVFVIRL